MASYCNPVLNGGDLHIVEYNGILTCVNCKILKSQSNKNFMYTTNDKLDMLDHIEKHINLNHVVHYPAMEKLKKEMEDEVKLRNQEFITLH